MSDEPTIKLRRLERRTAAIYVQGTAPLIVNRFDEKAKQMMLDAQQSKARRKKEPKDPTAAFEASRYLLPDGRDGVPAAAFKSAIVRAAKFFEGITMIDLKPAIHVVGEGPQQLVPLDTDGPTPREDVVRVGMGVADLRYRAQYEKWRVVIRVAYLPTLVDDESLVALVDAGGMGGIGEWRPSAPKSATGSYGTFSVVEPWE